MKKLLIGLILLIPLIILASVTLTTDVVSSNAYIPVDRVELNHEDITLSLNNFNDNIFSDFEAQIFPTSAKQGILWSIEDEICATVGVEDDTVARIDPQTGVLTMLNYGTCYVVATSVDGNKRAMCFVEIVGDEVQSVSIYNAPASVRVGASVLLNEVIKPSDAKNKNANWSVDDSNLATIDGNGILSAISVGNVTVTVTTEDGDFTASATISIVAGDVTCDKTVYTSAETLDLTAITSAPAAITSEGAAEIVGSVLNLNGDDEVTLSIGTETIVIRKCNDGDLIYKNIDLLYSETDGFIRMGNRLQLVAAYADSFAENAPAVTYISSAPDKAAIDSNGVITTFDKEGVVTFTATDAEGKTAVATFTIVRPVQSIALATAAARDKLGILGERVYANTTASDSGENTDYFAITFVRPKNPDYTQFTFTSSQPELADFTNPDAPNLIYFNREAVFSGKQEILVTVSAKFPTYTFAPVSTTYVIKLVCGVNVDTYEEFKTALEQEKTLVIHSDIIIPAEVVCTVVKSDIYGNGFMIRPNIENNEANRYAYTVLEIQKSNVLVENATIRHGAPVSTDKGLQEFARSRFCLKVAGNYNGGSKEPTITGVRVQYCILENAMNNVELQDCEATFKGCLFRNCSTGAMLLWMDCYHTAYGIVEDCVFSHMDAIPICLMTNIMDGIYKEYKTTDEFLATGKMYMNLEVRGFLDIYNWRTLDNLTLFTLPEDVKDNPFLAGIDLQGIIRNELETEAQESLKYYINDNIYYHVGICVMGLSTPCPDNLVTGYEDAGYSRYTLQLHEDTAAFPGLARMFPCPMYLYGYNKEGFDLGPDEVLNYDFNENAQLYEDLANGRAK